MEPRDIDDIFRDKLSKSNDLHQKEMEAAKPFVWSAIQRKNGTKNTLTWYHMAAAMLAFFLIFSVTLVQILKNHDKKMTSLSERFDDIRDKYEHTEMLLSQKDIQISSLKDEFNRMESQLIEQDRESIYRQETIIYKTDTVYIKQIEYIASAPVDVKQVDLSENRVLDPSEIQLEARNNEEPRNDVIFPDQLIKEQQKQPGAIKFRFAALGDNN